MTITAKATLWIYPSETAQWHFLSITDKSAEYLRKSQEGKKRVGWGSIRIRATIGKKHLGYFGLSWERFKNIPSPSKGECAQQRKYFCWKFCDGNT